MVRPGQGQGGDGRPDGQAPGTDRQCGGGQSARSGRADLGAGIDGATDATRGDRVEAVAGQCEGRSDLPGSCCAAVARGIGPGGRAAMPGWAGGQARTVSAPGSRHRGSAPAGVIVRLSVISMPPSSSQSAGMK